MIITLMTRHYPDLGSNTSSVWNFCARFSDVISRGNQYWRREMSAVFLGKLTIIPRARMGSGSESIAEGQMGY